MELKKCILTGKKERLIGNTLYRIKALKDFGDVKKDDLGGWVEKYENLSQEGDCWIYNNAEVYENAKVYGDAKVFGNADISGNAKVCDNVMVYGDAKVYGDAIVYGNAWIYGNAEVRGNSEVYDYAEVYGQSQIYGSAKVFGNAEIMGNADVNSIQDYIVFNNNWSSGRYFTYTRSNNMWSVGCFYGTGKELIEKAYNDKFGSGKNYEKYVKFAENF